MRVARYIALLVGLGTVGFAVGDWASHPNWIGLVGLLLVIALFSLLLGYLFRPDPALRTTPVPPKEPRPAKEPRKPQPTAVWSEGWDASEARAARERRRR